MEARQQSGIIDDMMSKNEDIQGRSGHVAGCIGMKLLVWGGYQDEDSNTDRYLPPEDLWIYDVDFDKWTKETTYGSIPPGISGASCCFFDDFLYILFGHTDLGNTNRIFRLHLRTLHWERVACLGRVPSPRDKLAAWVYDNRMFCFGGFGVPLDSYLCENGEFVEDPSIRWFPIRGWNNQLLIFDPHKEEWTNPKCSGQPPLPRAAHGAARIGHHVYVFGGRHSSARLNDLHCLNLSTLTWSGQLTPQGDSPCGRSWHTFTAISPTKIFLYGGYTQDQKPLSDAWILDASVLQWTELNIAHRNPRLWHTTSVSSASDILIFGGCSNDILTVNQKNEHSNTTLVFRLEPKSLLRLCLESVFAYREYTQQSWDVIPSLLRNWLQIRLRSVQTSRSTTVSIEWAHRSHSPTCKVA